MEAVHETESVEGAWKAVVDWYLASGNAERDHLEKNFVNTSMNGNEDSKLFFARAEGKRNALSTSTIFGPDRKVVRMLTRRLPL